MRDIETDVNGNRAKNILDVNLFGASRYGPTF
jgi:hypothetical protein